MFKPTPTQMSTGQHGAQHGFVTRVAGELASKYGVADNTEPAGDVFSLPRQLQGCAGRREPDDLFQRLSPNKFMSVCGYRRLKECVDRGEIQVDAKIMAALEQINAGNLRAGADLMAAHEQIDVVQPVYDRHADTFGDLATAEGLMPGDQTSIPIADTCTRTDLVSIGDLNIANPLHRVEYYKLLMNRMMAIEGLQ